MLSKITKKQLWELLVAIVHNVVASGFQLSSKQLASAAELERLRVVALFRYNNYIDGKAARAKQQLTLSMYR